MVDQAAESASGIESLNRCTGNALPQLIHEVIDEICVGKAVNFNKYENQWNNDEWTSMIEELKRVIILSARSSEVLMNMDNISKDIQQNIKKCLTLRREELHRFLINETCAISKTILKDFDWTAKYVLGSDSMASLKEPLLTLDLELKQVKDSKIVSVEMTKDDLLKLINTLESAQKCIMDLKV